MVQPPQFFTAPLLLLTSALAGDQMRYSIATDAVPVAKIAPSVTTHQQRLPRHHSDLAFKYAATPLIAVTTLERLAYLSLLD